MKVRFYQLKYYAKEGIVSAVVNKWQAGVINFVHTHDCYEIDYIIKGKGKYNFNGESLPIEAGKLYFNSPADVHNMEIEEYTDAFHAIRSRLTEEEQEQLAQVMKMLGL